MRGAVRTVTIARLRVGIHYGWLGILALVTWSLAGVFLPQEYPDWPGWLYWLSAGTAALLLLWSSLLHEAAHALVGRRFGRPMPAIMLFALGEQIGAGVPYRSARQELLTAAAGPAVSLVLAGLLFDITTIMHPLSGPLAAPLNVAALVNLLLGLLNLIPAFPLDGGRIAAALIWRATGSRERAARLASALGHGIGYFLVFAGVFLVLSGLVLTGIWALFIGWLLGTAPRFRRERPDEDANLPPGTPIA